MKKIDESEVLNMASTIQVRVEDELKSKSDAPMRRQKCLQNWKSPENRGCSEMQILWFLI